MPLLGPSASLLTISAPRALYQGWPYILKLEYAFIWNMQYASISSYKNNQTPMEHFHSIFQLIFTLFFLLRDMMNLEPIPETQAVWLNYTLDAMPAHCRTPRSFTPRGNLVQQPIHFPEYFCRRWEETGEPGRNAHKHKENMWRFTPERWCIFHHITMSVEIEGIFGGFSFLISDEWGGKNKRIM